ncbi:MAG: hypothetical protein IKL96_00110, partial [Kiritimatiellae bacterium]|nr:hypothetical protein [Kiritimatiellia bacterium]
MGLEHLYGRIVAVALGALLGVCALLATAKFVRRRARLLSPLVRAHGALFAVMMGAVAGTSIIVASVKPENAPTNMVGRAAPSAPQEPVNGAPLRRPGGWPP